MEKTIFTNSRNQDNYGNMRYKVTCWCGHPKNMDGMISESPAVKTSANIYSRFMTKQIIWMFE